MGRKGSWRFKMERSLDMPFIIFEHFGSRSVCRYRALGSIPTIVKKASAHNYKTSRNKRRSWKKDSKKSRTPIVVYISPDYFEAENFFASLGFNRMKDLSAWKSSPYE